MRYEQPNDDLKLRRDTVRGYIDSDRHGAGTKIGFYFEGSGPNDEDISEEKDPFFSGSFDIIGVTDENYSIIMSVAAEVIDELANDFIDISKAIGPIQRSIPIRIKTRLQTRGIEVIIDESDWFSEDIQES